MSTVADVRKEFKQIGYRLKVKTYSEFKALEVFNAENQKLTSILSREDYEKFKPAIDLREKFKGKIFDGEFRVVI